MEIDQEKAIVDAPKIKNVGEGERLALSEVSVRSGAVLKIPFSKFYQ